MVQIGGPTGRLVVVVSGIIAKYGVDGLFMCTMMAGVLLVIMGLTGHWHRGALHSPAGRHRLHRRHRD
jgi:TRAP-type C4-dicarboxylate transport system permease large subunit